MWQAPNQRMKAQSNSKKRDQDRNRMTFHIKRVAISILLQVPGGEPLKLDARALLNDFSPGGMGLFTAHQFNPDDEITITFETPKKIEIKGRIAWCQRYFVVGKVLKEQDFSFRAGVQFTFATAEEEAAVKAFCEELTTQHQCVQLSAA
jgi:hypothetical protein